MLSRRSKQTASKAERSFLFLTEHHELHAETGAVRLTLDSEVGLDHRSTGPLTYGGPTAEAGPSFSVNGSV